MSADDISPRPRTWVVRSRQLDEPDADLASAVEEDPDSLLLSDYLCGALSPDESRFVERRLTTDSDFARFAAPLIEARDTIRSEAAREYSNPYDVEVAWQHARARAGLPPLVASDVRNFLSAKMGVAEIRSASARPIVGKPARLTNVRARRIVARMAFVAVEVAVVFAVIFATLPNVRDGYMWHVVAKVTADGERVDFDDSSYISLKTGARFALRREGLIFRIVEELGRRDAFLDGGATVHLRLPKGNLLMLRTPFANIDAREATYTVRPTSPCETVISAESGTIKVSSRYHLDDEYIAEQGSAVTIGCDGVARRGR